MATATAAQPQPGSAEYTRKAFDVDPKTALELALAENERIKMELRSTAEIDFTAEGLQPRNMAGLWRMAMMYSKSNLVPEHFRNNPEDCCIALEMAHRCKVGYLMFLQKCYVVYGRPAIESQLAVAMCNSSGVFKNRIAYKMSGEGDERQCEAWGIDAKTGEYCSMIVSIKTAKDMKWWEKKDSLWPKMPELMLRYRAAMWLIRTTAPDVLMGMASKEEAIDIGRGGELIEPSLAPKTLDTLADRVKGEYDRLAEEAAQQENAEPTKAVDAGKPPEETNGHTEPTRPPRGTGPWGKFLNNLMDCQNASECDQLYDLEFGPTSTGGYTQEQRQQAPAKRDERKKALAK